MIVKGQEEQENTSYAKSGVAAVHGFNVSRWSLPAAHNLNPQEIC